MVDDPDPVPAGKWREIERRMLAIEQREAVILERLSMLSASQDKYEAIGLERQKTLFNSIAVVQSSLSRIDKQMNSWLVAIAGTSILGMGSLAMLIITRGLQ